MLKRNGPGLVLLETHQEGFGMDEWLMAAIHWITRAVEIVGIGIIVVGATASLISFLRELPRQEREGAAVGQLRTSLGRSILLGLEFLVAADIINTVAIEPTLQSVAVLAGIVLIRTFLSFSLEVEIEGRWPWRRGERPESASSP